MQPFQSHAPMSSTDPAPAVLIVEDDPGLREALCDTLACAGFPALSAADGTAALETLQGSADIGLVVSDVEMTPMNGLDLLSNIKASQPELPVLLMTAFGTIQQAVDAMQEGAADYLVKPFEAEVLASKVSRYCREPSLEERGQGGDLVAVDPASVKMRALAERVAESDVTVMISGDSGTGKEVLAQHIHRHSARREGPFVALNCAAIPENMLEALLFGYEKGAYTGAHKACPGKFEQADGGTLLLDEISEMALELQAKLLRVLQEREVERLGASAPIPLDVRVIATTNRNLQAEVAAGRFREDLFYRLNVFPLHLSPLRERPGDITPLAKHLLARAGARAGKSFSLSHAAGELLVQHSWPGNVRELDNVIQRATVLALGDTIDANAIVFEATPQGLSPGDDSGASPSAAAMPGANGASALPPAGGYPPRLCEPDDAHDESTPDSLGRELRQNEFRLIADALHAHGGSRKAVAERLGISARTLRYKLARMREAGMDV